MLSRWWQISSTSRSPNSRGHLLVAFARVAPVGATDPSSQIIRQRRAQVLLRRTLPVVADSAFGSTGRSHHCEIRNRGADQRNPSGTSHAPRHEKACIFKYPSAPAGMQPELLRPPKLHAPSIGKQLTKQVDTSYRQSLPHRVFPGDFHIRNVRGRPYLGWSDYICVLLSYFRSLLLPFNLSSHTFHHATLQIPYRIKANTSRPIIFVNALQLVTSRLQHSLPF